MTLLTTRWSWHKPSEPVQLRFWFPRVLPALHRSFLCCLSVFSLRKTPYEAPHGLHQFCSEGPWPCHGCRQTPSENQEVWRRNWIEDKFHAFAARFCSSKHQNRSRPLRPLHSWFITCSYEHLRASEGIWENRKDGALQSHISKLNICEGCGDSDKICSSE